ncbi:MAG: SPOR domain-containing protein [Candidatus Omnitrophica bacterium]|nr:SPOR domain-containing protein [Candidatus Omnitrophota bacterium]
MADGKGMFKGSSEGGLFVSDKKPGNNNKVWLFLLFLIGLFAVLFIYNKHQEQVRKAKMEELMTQQTTNSTDVQYQFYENGEQDKTMPAGTSKTGTQALNSPTTATQEVVAPAATGTAKAVSETTTEAVKATKAVKSVAEKTVSKAVKSSIGSAYAIQVASFKEESKANTVVANLKKHSFEPYIITKDLGEKGIWYRVYVGHFDSKKAAEAVVGTLPKEYKGLVVASKK